MITLKDIAQKAGVAVSTVSYALNNDPRIPEETKNHVIETAKELGYTGKSGRKHSQGYIRQAVLCLNSMRGDIFTEIVKSLKSVLKVSNCELLIYIGTNISKIKWMDGLFVLNSKVETSDIEEITRRHIPVVMMDRDVTVYGATNVTLDNFNGCYNVTKKLIDRGAKSFAFIGGSNRSFESQDRYEGFSKALSDALPQNNGAIVLQSDFTYDGGINVSHYLLEMPNLPNAIVCANDETAMGVYDGLKRKGLEDKVMLAGFDGAAPKSPFRYVTAKAEHKHWGAIAAYSMLQMFDHVKTTEQKIKIPVEVMEYY